MNKNELFNIFAFNSLFQYLYNRIFNLFKASTLLVSIFFLPIKNIPVLSAARIQIYVLFKININNIIKKTPSIQSLPTQLNSSDVIDESKLFQINQLSTLLLIPKLLT